jgi:hypothetical protein
MKCRLRDTLWVASDWLCALGIAGRPGESPPRHGAYRLTFELGHWLGELGWLLRTASLRQGE